MPRVDSNLLQLGTRVPRGLHRAVKLAALEEDVSVREWVADALAAHLRRCRSTDANESGPSNASTTIRRLAGA